MTWAVREKGYSQRRACGLVGLDPKTYRYASKRSGDEELRVRLRELASRRRGARLRRVRWGASRRNGSRRLLPTCLASGTTLCTAEGHPAASCSTWMTYRIFRTIR
jgi:hypothetical protein